MARRGTITAVGGIPIPESFFQAKTTLPDVGEWIDKAIWDTQTYLAAGSATLNFFRTTSVNPMISNMEAAGNIPGNKAFLVRAIGVQVFTPAAAVDIIADLAGVINRGVCRLFIGNKDYSEWPIYLLSESGGVFGDISDGTAATLLANVGNGIPDPRASYTLSRPLLIENQLNFTARCEWPALGAVGADVSVRVILKGELGRQVQ
jgi:hypothetical protein